MAAAPVNGLGVLRTEEVDETGAGVEEVGLGVVIADELGLVITAGGVEDGVVTTFAGVVLVLRVELLETVFHGAQPSGTLEVELEPEAELEEVEPDVVVVTEVTEDEDVEDEELDEDEVDEVVVDVVVEELDDPQEAPALTENWVESGRKC